jgi:transketolase
MSTPSILGMRDSYFEALFKVFKADPNCVMITADNGAPSLDQFSQELPKQFLQVGIAEQAMMAMATGLAFEGKKVWVYAIAPFVTTRVHEFVKLDVCAMKMPITILGVGAGLAYDNMGPSHHTLEDISIMRVLPGLEIYSPADSICAAWLATLPNDRPRYIRFDRAGLPTLYYEGTDFSSGLFFTNGLPKLVLVATGVMVHQAHVIASRLPVKATIVDAFRLSPFPFSPTRPNPFVGGMPIVTLEEHFLPGGLGSIISEALHDAGMTNRLLRIGMPQEFVFTYGGREEIWKKYGLDVETVTKRIAEWV